MQIQNLDSLPPDSTIETDLAIIGSGPAGLTIAREFCQTVTRVLIVESGQLREESRLTNLNSVESVGEPQGTAQIRKRIEFVGPNCPSWSNESQRFGVRCRVFGGSSHAWLGKSAVFDEIDFAERDWVPYSGWPFGRETVRPYVDRAAETLNLRAICDDDRVWDQIGIVPPAIDPEMLKSCFWQFARSRISHRDVLRFGPEFLRASASNVRVLLNATVTRIITNETGQAFNALEISSIHGKRLRVQAKAAVLAAGAIENPRLLLASANGVHPHGVGNENDLVGRFLMDHPSGTIGHFAAADAPLILKHFGFYGKRHGRRAYIYTHGLALSKQVQEREKLLHSAAYMAQEYALDDPWSALKRLLGANTNRLTADLVAVASGAGLFAKGLCIKLFESNVVPQQIRNIIVDALIKFYPNFVAREYQTQGMPHKLKGVIINGITEQIPDPESRITLSDKADPLGVPMARVEWRIDDKARHSLIRLGHLLAAELPRAGLPTPILEDWIARERPQDSDMADIAHTSGTTRMSDDPKHGVVNSRCQVHGVTGLYVAGASVFPTSGHANPTLMLVSLALRLADQLKADLT